MEGQIWHTVLSPPRSINIRIHASSRSSQAVSHSSTILDHFLRSALYHHFRPLWRKGYCLCQPWFPKNSTRLSYQTKWSSLLRPGWTGSESPSNPFFDHETYCSTFQLWRLCKSSQIWIQDSSKRLVKTKIASLWCSNGNWCIQTQRGRWQCLFYKFTSVRWTDTLLKLWEDQENVSCMEVKVSCWSLEKIAEFW